MNPEDRINYYTEMQKTKDKFYESHKKHTVFKNTQKLQCAQHVSDQLDLNKMIQCTAFIVPNTNVIYYNYMVFKTYGNDNNHLIVYDYVVNLISRILEEYKTFEFHINLKSFTISACQRYYNMICSSFDDNKFFTEKMSKMVVYHTPNIVDQLTKLLYNSIKDVIHKVEYCHKESEERIKVLFDM